MKRFFAFLLLVVLCLTCFLTACEKKNKKKGNDPQPQGPSEQQQQQDKAVIADALNIAKYFSAGEGEPAESSLLEAIGSLQDALDLIGHQFDEKEMQINFEALIDEGTEDERETAAIIGVSDGVFYFYDEEYERYANLFAEIPYAIEFEDDGRISLEFPNLDISELLLESLDLPLGDLEGEEMPELPFALPGADDLEYRDGLYFVKDAYFINLLQSMLFGEVDLNELPAEYREQYVQQMAEATQMLTEIFNNLHLSIAFGVSQNKISRLKISVAPNEQFFEALSEFGIEMPELPFSSCSIALDLSIDVAHDLPTSFSLEAHAPDFADATLSIAFQSGSILPKTIALDANAPQYGEAHINATFHDGLPVPAQLTVQANIPGVTTIDASLSTGLKDGFPVSLTTEGTVALYGLTLDRMSSSHYDTDLEEWVTYEEEKVVGDMSIQFNIALDLSKVGGAANDKPLDGSIVISSSNCVYTHNGVVSAPIPDEMGFVKTIGLNFDSENYDGYSVLSMQGEAVRNGNERSTISVSVTMYPDSAPDYEPLDDSYTAVIAKRDEAKQKIEQVVADLLESDIEYTPWEHFYIHLDGDFYISFYLDEYMEEGEFDVKANFGDYYTTLEYENGRLVAVEHQPAYAVEEMPE